MDDKEKKEQKADKPSEPRKPSTRGIVLKRDDFKPVSLKRDPEILAMIERIEGMRNEIQEKLQYLLDKGLDLPKLYGHVLRDPDRFLDHNYQEGKRLLEKELMSKVASALGDEFTTTHKRRMQKKKKRAQKQGRKAQKLKGRKGWIPM